MNSQSTKRARSPDGGAPSERPAKRQFSSLVNRMNIRQLSGSPHPEDWVLQAGGLSIDSPLNPSTPSFIPSPQNDSEDVDMAIDDEAESTSTNSYFDTNPAGNAQFQPSVPTSSEIPFTPHRLGASTFSSSQTPITFPRLGPSINVLPPTPVIGLPQGHASNQQSHSFATPPRPPPADALEGMSPAPMMVSPKMSFAQPISISSPAPSTPSKKRLIMGPKAGCEKCRLGVKGHYMHYE
ncbi:hypothetical protein CVT24_000852 [Panaeolus cyanescens]|uniref:Uncharacterized protein n=1 Tax=Panaeolus cyanescens TaxID=181874 RepID=A0A409VVL6_9AGAR|nr:hypothetical protein CVT24_000852 [Panaeolus cyanescens]